VTTVLLFVLAAVMLPLLLSEFGDWCPWLASRLVRWSARRLGSPAACARYEEEWTANLNEVPGKLSQLAAALGYLACVPRMRWVLRRRPYGQAVALPRLTSAVPAVSGSFTGRRQELDLLTRFLHDGDSRAAIIGMPGIGKTELAAHAAHLLRDQFTGGCVWLRCWRRPSLKQELQDHLALWGVLPSSGTFAGERDCAKLFASMVSHRHVLVVFDDVADLSQIQEILPRLSNCAVIVTSRRSLDLQAISGTEIHSVRRRGTEWTLTATEGARTLELELGPMAPGEAEEHVRRRIGFNRCAAEQDSVASLIALCDGSPLALAIAAGLCRDNEPIAGVVQRLREPSSGTATQMRDETIRRSIDLTVRLLSPGARQLFRRLSLLGMDTFEEREAAVLSDDPVPSIDKLLDELVRVGLLQQVGGPSRNRLHDLLRTYARELLRSEEPPEEIDRLTAKLDAMRTGS